jgi:TldD protein
MSSVKVSPFSSIVASFDAAPVPAPDTALAVAEREMLAPAGLDFAALDRGMDALMASRLDYGDIYCQLTRHETWTVEDGIVKEGVYSVDKGVGVRAVVGEKTGFAYAEQLDEAAFTDAAIAARGIAHSRGGGRAKVAARVTPEPLYPALDPLVGLPDADKVGLLADLDRRIRQLDPRIVQVLASLAGVYELVLVQASDGTLAADVRPLVRLNVSVILEQGGRRESGYAGAGGRGEFGLVTSGTKPMDIAREAVRQAAVNLEARPAPAGNMPVVLGPGWPGVLLHEAIGHGLEGDFNRKGTSAFSGRIGERVATE